jgi:hypothetical protein
MQIVIEIDDNLYTRLFDNGVDNYDDAEDMAKAIGNGIPLPGRHGRLIDVDALIDTLGCSDRDIYVKACIEEDATTIIKADKE